MARVVLPVYSEEAAKAKVQAELTAWSVEGNALVRTYATHGWKAALMVVNTVGHLAEVAWHHPEILASYSSVRVSLNTHEAGGVTDRDFELAKKIEDVVMWQPGKDGGVLEGTPTDPRHAYIKYGA